MDKQIFDGFYEKFKVSTRPGRGGKYPFVPANDVTDRMNQLFKGNWCSEVKSQETYEDGTVIVRVKISVLDSESKAWFWHEGFGGHKDTSGEPGSSFKSAYSKALVNACRRWGVGLYLDDEAPSEVGFSGPATQKSQPIQTSKPMTAVSTQGLPPAPAKPAGPPAFASPQIDVLPSVSKPPVVEQTAIQQVVPIPPVQTVQEPFKPMSEIPKPMHGAPLNGAHMAKPTTVPTTITTETPSVDSVSDVQKIAIQSLYDMRGYKFADLAQEVLGNVPDINTLTHDQAVAVIQHGNDLYKKSKTN